MDARRFPGRLDHVPICWADFLATGRSDCNWFHGAIVYHRTSDTTIRRTDKHASLASCNCGVDRCMYYCSTWQRPLAVGLRDATDRCCLFRPLPDHNTYADRDRKHALYSVLHRTYWCHLEFNRRCILLANTATDSLGCFLRYRYSGCCSPSVPSEFFPSSPSVAARTIQLHQASLGEHPGFSAI